MCQTMTLSKDRRICEGDCEEEDTRHMDWIHGKSDFKFIRIHLLPHSSDHILLFGNIPIYSTEFGELTHKEQIKDR